MKRTWLLLLLFLPSIAAAESIPEKIGDGAKAVYKAADIDWGGKTLKWSFILTATATNGLRMLKEADHWDEKDILPGDTYHAVDLAYISGCVFLGILATNIWQHDEWTWRQKAALYAGTALATWEVGEGVYKSARYGNWFDNDPDHNRCAIPYYAWENGSFRDRFISTGYQSTIYLHTSRIALSSYLFARVP